MNKSKKWYDKKGLEYHREYRNKNRENRRKWNREWIANNKERYNASKYLYRDRTKLDILKYYSDGDIKCKNCGFDNIDGLCLDHIENDGAKHRKELKISSRGIFGQNTYEAIKKAGYPIGLQVLCANCNLIKEIELKRKKRLLNPFYREKIEGGDVS